MTEEKVQEALKARLQEGLQEGRMIEKIELIRKNFAKGMSMEDIADFLGEPIDVIKCLIANL